MRLSRRIAVVLSGLTLVAAGLAWSANRAGVAAQSRTYDRTVTAEASGGGGRREVWTLGVAHRDNTLSTSLRANVGPDTCDGAIEATPPRGQRGTRIEKVTKVDSFTIKMKCPDFYEVHVSGGKIVKETPARRGAARRVLERLSATLAGYDRAGGTLRFTAKGDDGGSAINWACEKATLKAMVSCTLNPLGCGDDVDKQFCACAPKVPNAPPCET